MVRMEICLRVKLWALAIDADDMFDFVGVFVSVCSQSFREKLDRRGFETICRGR